MAESAAGKRTTARKTAPKKQAVTSRSVVSTKKDTKKVATPRSRTRTTPLKKASRTAPTRAKKNTKTRVVLTSSQHAQNKLHRTLTHTAVWAAMQVAHLPMRADRYMSPVARFSGVAFVLLGGICTLFFAQQVWGGPLRVHDVHNEAALCDATVMTTAQYLSCTSAQTTTTTTTTSTITKQTLTALSATSSITATGTSSSSSDGTLYETQARPATFTMSTPDPLTGIVTITVTVSDASTVNVLAFINGDSKPVALGTATAGSVAGTWLFRWDTRQYQNAHYVIGADIFNAYYATAPYRVVDTVSHTVQNASTISGTSITATTSTSSSDQSSATATSVTQTQAEPVATLSLDESQPLSATGHIHIAVPYADSVSLYAYAAVSGTEQFLGQADQIDATHWEFALDTTHMVNGSYNVFALVHNYTGSYRTGIYSILVQNPATTKPPLPTATTTEPKQVPSVTLNVPISGTLSGIVSTVVRTSGAAIVEIHAVPHGSEIDHFIGLARIIDTGIWSLPMDTRNIPNGSYDLFAHVKNAYGEYNSTRIPISIYNKPQAVPLSAAEQHHLQTLASSTPVTPPISFSAVTAAEQSHTASTSTDRIAQAVDTYGSQLDAALQRYAVAYRVHDTASMQLVQNQLDTLRDQIVVTVTHGKLPVSDADQVTAYINDRIRRFIASLPQVDALLSARLGADVSKDSDHDGVSDYDEVTLYHTNPYSADTDGDGIPDGVEIMNGTDPLNPNNGTQAVRFQLPQDNGVERTDILAVKSITAVAATATPAAVRQSTTTAQVATSTATTSAAAVISGIGLPDSFVTLYVFSTPVIVTVHTNPDGSWEYRFDKELPDGTHTIYVGITDNAGRIIAKSAPFTFVKQASAYTETSNSALATVVDQPEGSSLLSQNMIYLVVSISVVAIGLILIMLGLHLEWRRRHVKDLIGQAPLL